MDIDVSVDQWNFDAVCFMLMVPEETPNHYPHDSIEIQKTLSTVQ